MIFTEYYSIIVSLLSLILWWCPTWLHCCVAVSQPAYSSGFCTHPNMQMHSAYCYCTVTPLTIEPGWYRRSSAVMRRSTSAAVMQRSTSSLSYCDVELRKGTAHLVFFFFVKNISYVFERISMVSEHISSKIYCQEKCIATF